MRLQDNKTHQETEIVQCIPYEKSLKEASFFCFIVLSIALIMAACSSINRRSDADIRLAEAQAELAQLQVKYRQTRVQAEELDIAIREQGYLEPQVIIEPIIFAEGGKTLERVQDRGILHCGTNANAPGFGFLDPNTGDFVGFDIDFCHAVGIAIFGKEGTNSVKMIPLTSRRRFTELQSGKIDLLIRNTTWTLSQDVALGFDFAPTIFYDGQGMIVSIESGITKLSHLVDKTICVTADTTSEQNLAQYYYKLDLQVKIAAYEDISILRQAYENESCTGFTSDRSALLGQQLLLEKPEEHRILDESISREPLGPLVRHGDSNWHDIVFWTVQCTLNGEYLGVNQKNVEQLREESDDLAIQRLLGKADDLGKALGLHNDFCYNILSRIGNYSDIYERHLGLSTPFNLPRGLNALFNEGGILYPIPFK